MEHSIDFTFKDFQESLINERYSPPRMFAPHISVDRRRYEELRRNSRELDFTPLRKRVDSRFYDELRCAVGVSVRYSRFFFPAYQFVVNEYINDEWLAAVDWHKQFHRDHVVHQPLTAYVGMKLLKSKIPGLFEPNLLDKCVDILFESDRCQYLFDYLKTMNAPRFYVDKGEFSKEFWKDLFLDAFYLAALFHDIGYPWKFVNIIHDKLGPHSPLTNPAGQGYEWIANSYRDRLVFYPLNGYRSPDPTEPSDWIQGYNSLTKKGILETHGLPGAITLLHLNDILRQFPGFRRHDKPVRRFCIEWAAMAVMMHDMAGVYGRINGDKLDVHNPHLRLSLYRDPLSFVLFLADQIQDFHRPNSTFESEETADIDGFSEKEKIIIKYNLISSKTKLEWDDKDKVLTIVYVYNKWGDWLQNVRKFLPQNEMLCFNSLNGYLDYSGLPVKRICLNGVKE